MANNVVFEYSFIGGVQYGYMITSCLRINSFGACADFRVSISWARRNVCLHSRHVFTIKRGPWTHMMVFCPIKIKPIAKL